MTHTTPVIVCYNLCSYPFEKNIIQVLLSSPFNTPQVKSHHCRIIATHTFDITTVLVSIPPDTIYRIILMTKHESFLRQAD